METAAEQAKKSLATKQQGITSFHSNTGLRRRVREGACTCHRGPWETDGWALACDAHKYRQRGKQGGQRGDGTVQTGKKQTNKRAKKLCLTIYFHKLGLWFLPLRDRARCRDALAACVTSSSTVRRPLASHQAARRRHVASEGWDASAARQPDTRRCGQDVDGTVCGIYDARRVYGLRWGNPSPTRHADMFGCSRRKNQ